MDLPVPRLTAAVTAAVASAMRRAALRGGSPVMKAKVGDTIVVEGNRVGEHGRVGVVVDVPHGRQSAVHSAGKATNGRRCCFQGRTPIWRPSRPSHAPPSSIGP